MDRKIKSFAVCISNAEAVSCLDDAMAGRLFKALFDYASNGIVPKWNDKVERQSIDGRVQYVQVADRQKH